MKNNDYIFGIHSVTSLLKTNSQTILQLYLLKGRHDQRFQSIIQLAQMQQIALQETDRKKLDEMVKGQNHQGVVAYYRVMEQWNENDLEKILAELTEPPFLLILDEVQDPHNLGACLRTANAANVHAVLAPKDNSVGITSAVRKVACGAAEITPFIQVTNLARTLRWLREQGIWLFGTSHVAQKNIYQADLTGPMALVLGAEGKGMRRLTEELCDFLISIPMAGTVESLNVSVATGICLFEAVRQRQRKEK